MAKHKEKLYTLEDAKKELIRQEESDIYFINFMHDVSEIIDSCYRDNVFMSKYSKFIPRRTNG